MRVMLNEHGFWTEILYELSYQCLILSSLKTGQEVNLEEIITCEGAKRIVYSSLFTQQKISSEALAQDLSAPWREWGC